MPLPTDSIANLLTKIRNASNARRESTMDSFSGPKEAIVKVLTEKGFIKGYHIDNEDGKQTIVVTLKPGKNSLSLRRMSKPGQRIYVASRDIKRVKNGQGIGIYSTSKGIMADYEAKRSKVGGEYLCEVS